MEHNLIFEDAVKDPRFGNVVNTTFKVFQNVYYIHFLYDGAGTLTTFLHTNQEFIRFEFVNNTIGWVDKSDWDKAYCHHTKHRHKFEELFGQIITFLNGSAECTRTSFGWLMNQVIDNCDDALDTEDEEFIWHKL